MSEIPSRPPRRVRKDKQPQKAMSEPTMNEDGQVDLGFKLIDEGTLGVKFHIYNVELRNELVEAEVLPREAATSPILTEEQLDRVNKRAIYTFESILSRFGVVRVEKSGDRGPFFEAMAKQLEAVRELQRAEFAETKQVHFGMLPLVLEQGKMYGFVHEGCKVVGEVERVVQSFHPMFGPFARIVVTAAVRGPKGFKYGTATHIVMGYDDGKALKDIGLFEVTDAHREELIARGKKYVELTTKPSYVYYNSSIVYRNWRGDRRFNAIGRAMVDITTMSIMDSDYEEYFADPQDHYGMSEDATKIDLDMTTERNLIMCPPYVYGFSFVSKVWGEMKIDEISAIPFRDQAFEKLVLEPKYKRIIKSLVSSGKGAGSGDLIAGKGGGCVFLLHGEPGIGKTLTAEAIAEQQHRPLYSVSAGELGTEPTELDKNLKQVLDICQAWNAVLLIDEVDIFMERRTKNDIHRNAMVGIFLQLIEYYQGIMFLTTNRVEEIDEAFYSRISLGIKYPNLGYEQRKIVWENLLAFVENKADNLNLSLLASKEINGRQIKHIIRLANTLAQSEGRSMTMDDLRDIMDAAMEFKA